MQRRALKRASVFKWCTGCDLGHQIEDERKQALLLFLFFWERQTLLLLECYRIRGETSRKQRIAWPAQSHPLAWAGPVTWYFLSFRFSVSFFFHFSFWFFLLFRFLFSLFFLYFIFVSSTWIYYWTRTREHLFGSVNIFRKAVKYFLNHYHIQYVFGYWKDTDVA